jgi:hypothetical protein
VFALGFLWLRGAGLGNHEQKHVMQVDVET